MKRLNFVLCLVCTLSTSSAARADSAVAWGDNFRGELGDGTTTAHSSPMPVVGMGSGVTAVAAGRLYSLAVQNGGAYSWGSNDIGQLGDGTMTNRLTPVPVSGLASGVTAVAANPSPASFEAHSLAVQNGAVYAWGRNSAGKLGNGTSIRSNTPVAVIGMDSGVTAIAAGTFHSLAVKNGGLYGWGANGNGQLGDGTTTQRLLPVPVIGLSSGVTAIAAGASHGLAVKDGGVYSWGDNQFGQIGDGTVGGIRITPALVGGLESGATAVAAGGDYSLAVANGRVYAWGLSFAASRTPVLVDPTHLTDIVAVAGETSVHYGYALSSDGSVWGWSVYDSFGTTPYTSQHLLPPAGYKFTSIAAADYHVVATLAAIPEPSSLLLAALVAAGLLWRKRVRERLGGKGSLLQKHRGGYAEVLAE
jgi:alpha-tubulin suppressor-like RCC1 family protein